MIAIRSAGELKKLQRAGQISARALKLAGESIRVGMTTKELDDILHRYIVSQGAKPSFLGYGGFPGTACISVNDEVIHGIPSGRKLLEGDIVSVDVGAFYDGYHGDNAATFPVGKISDDAAALMDATQQSLYEAIAVAKPGARIGDIGHTVEQYCVSRGYGVVRQYVGHGVGQDLHEPPDVPNYGQPGRGVRLVAGMVIAIEPMINQRGDSIRIMPDKWTVKTANGSLSAHFEHTIAITPDGAVILTKP